MRYLTLIVLIFSTYLSYSQDLFHSRHTSYRTFIYKITNEEAREINSGKHWVVDSAFFHTLVDTYPTDSLYQKELLSGHYLKVYAEGNHLQLEYTSVQPYDIAVFNNSTDLNLKVFDLLGTVIQDAKVKVKGRRVSYDKRTQTYRIRKSNKKGLISVSHDGHIAYYQLDRRLNNPLPKRVFRKTIYGSPLKYAWRPVRFVVYIPIDGVKSIVRRYPTGSIGKITHHSERLFHTVACWFDDYHCDWYGDDWKFREKHKGYMVFSKPKYMPGDTVRFKAFITKKNGKPITKPMEVSIYHYPKTINLGEIIPYDDGGYAHEFVLSDTLDLTLDKSYTIDLSDHRDRTYISQSFQYEEYELGKIKLSLNVPESVQYRGDTAVIEVKGTDENDLNLLDGRLEVLVSPSSMLEYFEDNLFVPDTLAYYTLALEPRGTTKVKVPDSIFSRANMSYKVEVRLLTSDNERLAESEYLTFYEHRAFYDYELEDDSIRLTYELNGKEQEKVVNVVGYDAFLNPVDTLSLDLPAAFGLNPYFETYQVIAEGKSRLNIDISEEEPLLSFRAQRTTDSLIVESVNSRKIPFVYYLYKTNQEIQRGNGKELTINKRTSTNQNYYLAVQYLWGGRVVDNNYEIALDKNKLQINVTTPPVVYPGQKVELQIDVMDSRGKPVADVDILAHGLTKKFKAQPVNMPVYDEGKKDRQLINTFELDEEPPYQESQPYVYERWNPLMALDSIEYFKFLYPKGLYRYDYTPQDSITQFSPFVIRDGVIQSVAVVYVDRVPVYFSWATDEPYSLAVDSGYHQVQIRTEVYEYFLDSLYFSEGKKLIFSVDHNDLPKEVRVYERGSEVTESERSNLSRYVMPYRYTFQDRFGFFRQGDRYFSVKPGRYPHLAGPTRVRNVDFGVFGDFSQKYPFESFFEYELNEGLIKMRSKDEKELVPTYFNQSVRKEFEDLVYSEGSLRENWQQELKRRRVQSRKYSNPGFTRSGQGELIVEHDRDIEESILNTLLFKHDDPDFLRVYPGSNLSFHALRSGFYRLIYLVENGAYAVEDSISVQVDGTNHLRFEEELQPKDSFSLKLNTLMDSYFEKQGNNPLNREAKDELFRTYQQQYQYFGAGETITGYVYSSDGEALPGVSVLVKGTTFGTVTDIDGYYSIKVPYAYQELNFSFIGFSSKDIAVGEMNGSVVLDYDVQQLQEVVVVGYSSVEKKSLSAASVSVLNGRVAGVAIAEYPADVAVMIRGVGSISGDSNPLIIVDGVPYLGDMDDLDASEIDEMKILKSAELSALYGARAANGVLFISTNGALKADPLANIKGAKASSDFMEAVDQSSTIRNNFSDEAFWQPALKTDRKGQVKFEVTFPDDITQWETFVYAINDQRQTGKTRKGIKSFKPLAAQLSLPRFLLSGDSTEAIGKSLNYGLDTVEVKTTFEVGGQEVWTKNETLINAVVDTLKVVAGDSDSLKVTYYLTRTDGYFDGEKRKLQVFPVGLEKNEGQYAALYGDTTVAWSFADSLGTVSFYANARSMDLLQRKIAYLIEYPYGCNEQLASKLIALLVSKHLHDELEIKAARDGQIKRIIKKLLNNQNGDGLWGWWNNSSTSLWISTHVIEALTLAVENGFKVGLNNSVITDEAVWNLTAKKPVHDQVDWLYIAQMLTLDLDRLSFIHQLDTSKLTIQSKLRLEWVKGEHGLSTDKDWLLALLSKDQMGRQFISDTSRHISYYSDRSMEYTTMALRLLSRDSAFDVRPMEDYLIDKMSSSFYTNTYTTSKVLAILAPSLSGENQGLTATMTLDTDQKKTIDVFPYETTFAPGEFKLDKSGLMPIYVNAYQTYWEKRPIYDTTRFQVRSFFESGATTLSAGEQETLIVEVEVAREAEYVMVEVPIPAGCSYASKSNYYQREVHREYFKEKVSIFCKRLDRGIHRFEVELLPRYRGSYTLNPAKAELMYFPIFYGHEGVKRFRVD
ncbi:MAG: carboxypeptidase-like regulatory domain-containing protein [Marinoscillum sp.]